MTVSERVAELLASTAIEEQILGHKVKEAARILGVALPSVYRLISTGQLGHIKVGDGAVRKGKDGKKRGRAGSVRVRLIDIVTYQVAHERVPGSPAKGHNTR